MDGGSSCGRSFLPLTKRDFLKTSNSFRCFLCQKKCKILLILAGFVFTLVHLASDSPDNPTESQKTLENAEFEELRRIVQIPLPPQLQEPIQPTDSPPRSVVYVLGPNISIDLHSDLKEQYRRKLIKPVSLYDNNYYKLNESLRWTRQLGIRLEGRLGNMMFAYASLFGISLSNYMTPILPENNILRQYFHISAKNISVDDSKYMANSWPKFQEYRACAYDERTEKLNYELDVELIGYFQSWKYFEHMESELRKEFTFKDWVLKLAERFIKAAVKRHTDTTEKVIRVGIHVRRGDMMDYINTERGYVVATRQYFEVAMKYFESIYQNVIFIVCSDDMMWTKHNIIKQNFPVVFADNYDDFEDLAILSLCDHMIISVGTFSWWAGWLAGGKVLYYSDFPSPYTPMSKIFEAEDYFKPHWVGLE